MAREMIATSNYVPCSEFFLDYTFTYLLLHHLHQRIPCLMPTDTGHPVPERSGSVSEDLGGDHLQKPKTKLKMRNAKKHKEICRMNCLTGYRDSENLVDESTSTGPLEKTQSKEVKTLPIHLMNFTWSRKQKWNRVRGSTV